MLDAPTAEARFASSERTFVEYITGKPFVRVLLRLERKGTLEGATISLLPVYGSPVPLRRERPRKLPPTLMRRDFEAFIVELPALTSALSTAASSSSSSSSTPTPSRTPPSTPKASRTTSKAAAAAAAAVTAPHNMEAALLLEDLQWEIDNPEASAQRAAYHGASGSAADAPNLTPSRKRKSTSSSPPVAKKRYRTRRYLADLKRLATPPRASSASSATPTAVALDVEPHCIVCMEEFTAERPAVRLSRCQPTHPCHKSCLLDWLSRKPTCPSCMQSYADAPMVPLEE